MGERHKVYVRLDDKMFGRFLDEGRSFNSSPFQAYAMDTNYRTDASKGITHAEKVLQAVYVTVRG